ncbi:hypothetical protein U9M48_014553 [Paspalum notatum var. saurae]|uniref:Uncharacterized protein n=1 Tax=Paspalum notatum var. saurae TaxID=547442 RepID=A0AAQ3WKU2_PASNO
MVTPLASHSYSQALHQRFLWSHKSTGLHRSLPLLHRVVCRCIIQGSAWACLWLLFFVAGLLVGGAISNAGCAPPRGVADPPSIEASLPRWASEGGRLSLGCAYMVPPISTEARSFL